MTWTLVVNVRSLVARWKFGELTITELADKVADRLERSRGVDLTPYPDTLRDHLNRLRQAETPAQYETAFEYIYDLADDDRVLIVCGG